MVQCWFVSEITPKKISPHSSLQLKQNGSKLESPQNKTTTRQVQFSILTCLHRSLERNWYFLGRIKCNAIVIFYFHKQELGQQSLRFCRNCFDSHQVFLIFCVPSTQTSFLSVKNEQHHQIHSGTTIPFSHGLVGKKLD